MVEEETKAMFDDSPELVSDEIDILAKLKKMLDANEKGEDDEILQTKNHFSSRSRKELGRMDSGCGCRNHLFARGKGSHGRSGER